MFIGPIKEDPAAICEQFVKMSNLKVLSFKQSIRKFKSTEFDHNSACD